MMKVSDKGSSLKPHAYKLWEPTSVVTAFGNEPTSYLWQG